ncbi:MAG TPA: preprotein translocase subunit SecD, partial [Methanobacteriales archaeon]|nr:preprotein translocase subunit SecD [Methanobacteriales archaeon]
YRTPILVLPIFFTTLAELILILGVAAIIRWNIDLAAIAGILAAIGTGVDDQIIMTD